MKKAGVKDIARQAGVSTGTVDRVLNNRGRVSDVTRSKVLAIAEELGYKPNLLAKSLSSKRKTRIGVVVPEFHENNPYWEKPVKGIQLIQEELSAYNVEVVYESFVASDEQSFVKTMQDMVDADIDGVVFVPFFENSTRHYAKMLNDKNVPFVFIDTNIRGVGKLSYFGQDAFKSGEVAGMLMATSLTHGAKVLVVKQARKKIFSNHVSERIKGFEKAVKPSSLKVDELEIDLLNANEPFESINKHGLAQCNYQGIFVPNSRAFKVADYLEENKIKGIPLIGYDLVDRNCEHLQKGNITFLLHQKPEEQTYSAIKALFEYVVLKKDIDKKVYSPIDIVVKQNIEYYK